MGGEEKRNPLISFAIDSEPLRQIAGKYGGIVLTRLGPIIGNEITLFQERQMIRQLENLRKFQEKFEEIKAQRGLPDDEPSPSVADPIIEEAAREERAVLRDLWAKLFAAAIDPQRQGAVRQQIISAAKQLDPFDVLLLEWTNKQPQGLEANSVAKLRQELGASHDDIQVSLDHLREIGLMVALQPAAPRLSPLGRLLMRAIAD